MTLTNDNQNLLNKIMMMKNEMADKMNEAGEIYQKGLEMLKKTGESPKEQRSSPDSGKLDEFMLSTISAPVKSAVPPLSASRRFRRSLSSRLRRTRTRRSV